MKIKTNIKRLFYVKFRTSRFNQLLKIGFFGSLVVVLLGMSVIDRLEKKYIYTNHAGSLEAVKVVGEAQPAQGFNQNGESAAVAKMSEAKRDSIKVTPLTSDIQAKIRRAFPGEEDLAVAVATCESQLDPKRIGDMQMQYPSVGLFQINQTWHKYTTKTLQDPDENIRIAKEIKDRWSGWGAWSCYRFGFYKKYLNQV